jgi:hypothetical protein
MEIRSLFISQNCTTTYIASIHAASPTTSQVHMELQVTTFTQHILASWHHQLRHITASCATSPQLRHVTATPPEIDEGKEEEELLEGWDVIRSV